MASGGEHEGGSPSENEGVEHAAVERGRKASWKGPDSDLAAAMKPSVSGPGFLGSQKFLEPASLMKNQLYWRSLHGLSESMSFRKTQMKKVLRDEIFDKTWRLGGDSRGVGRDVLGPHPPMLREDSNDAA